MAIEANRTNPNSAHAPWPSEVPPARASYEEFGRFIDARTAAFLEACQGRRLPAVLATAIERCADHYWLRSQRLRRLRYGRSPRRKRTERRCAHVAVLQFLIAHVDLASLQCLVATPAGLKPMSVGRVAEHTGLSLRRAEHVLADLARAGYLRTKPQHEKVKRADGTFEIVNHVAIRWLTPRLFADLGLGVKLTIERKRAHARRMAAMAGEAERRAGSETVAQMVDDAMRRERLAAVRRRRRSPVQPGLATEQLELMTRAATIRQQHPSWDRDACYAEARRQLGVEPVS